MKSKYAIPAGVGILAIIVIAIVYSSTSQFDSSSVGSASQSISIENAERFSVSYDGTNKILTDGADRTLVLTHDDVTSENQIQIPVERIVIFSSTHAAFMDRLEITDKIVGVAWGGNYNWYIDDIKDGLQSGAIRDIGVGNNPNYDEIVSLQPDLVVLVGGEGLWEKHAKKLDELKIPYVVNSEWLENTALGRFEWIKFFSIFVDKEDEAQKIYSEVKAKTSEIFSHVSESDTPTVLWAGVFRGTAYVPKGGSYIGEVLKNVNSKYAFEDLEGTGSLQISLEELVFKGSTSDFLIYSSDAVSSTSDIISINPILSRLGSIQNCQVYAFEPWYWQKIDRLDDFVNDIAAILHPEVFAGYELKQFKKVACE